MNEIVEQTKSNIEELLKKDNELLNCFVDCVLVNPDTNETITIARDRSEKTVIFAPYTIKENGYNNGYSNIADWEFNFDGYIFKELEKGYFVGYMSDNINYGIWNALEELYPYDIEYKDGVQKYLQYCADNGISKEYLDDKMGFDVPNAMKYFNGIGLFKTIEYKGYIIEADDLNLDNSEENLVNIYENKKDFENKEPIETISLNTIDLKNNVKEYIDDVYINSNTITISQWQYNRDSELHYFSFVLGYDLLNNMINKYDSLECDVNYDFCIHISEKFLNSEEYQNPKYSGYEALSAWVNDNKEIIEKEYRNFIGIEEKYGNLKILNVGHRKNEPIALVEKNNGQYGIEYIVAFNYTTKNKELSWGYGYYYDSINQANAAFDKVIKGGNLSKTFERNEDR